MNTTIRTVQVSAETHEQIGKLRTTAELVESGLKIRGAPQRLG